MYNYQCIVLVDDMDICVPIYSSISKVCKFLDTVDFDFASVLVVRSDGRIFNGKDLYEVWHG